MVPKLFPVKIEDVVRLEKTISLNPQLKAYWLKKGMGFFSSDENGEPIDANLTNALLAPSQILSILENAQGEEATDFDKGLPFFDPADSHFFF